MNPAILKRTNSDDLHFKSLIVLLDKDLSERNGTIQLAYDSYNLLDFIETIVVAYINDMPVGCGCFKKFSDDTIEIKRMFVTPLHRGKGIASVILNELELWATEMGYTHAVLETGTRHHEAIRLYQHLGYIITENYGVYADMEDSVCMQKSF
ncbi:MAG: family N-acetyltransferase [Mucilaginibacter sp.]|nr:family N-acetyltransferase [Mucilaginibacter sp.]